MNPLKRKITAAILFFLFAFLLIGFSYKVSSHKSNIEDRWFYFNTTESLPIGIYIKIPDFILTLQGREHNAIKRGDYVVFIPNEETLKIALERKFINENEDTYFLKKVGGRYGDSWTVDKDYNFYLNGEYYGNVFLKDKFGNNMPIRIGSFQINKDEFLPVGEAERSFDGRYTGVVKISNIKAVVYPLFTGLHW